MCILATLHVCKQPCTLLQWYLPWWEQHWQRAAGKGRAGWRWTRIAGRKQQRLCCLPEWPCELGPPALQTHVPVWWLHQVFPAVPNVQAVRAGVLSTLQQKGARWGWINPCLERCSSWKSFLTGVKNKRPRLCALRLNVEARLFMGGYVALTCRILLFFVG